jgi:ferredoxin--NADP+ reductase
MSFKVVNRQVLSPDVKRLDILAPLIARRIYPGQFVIVTVQERGERIALPVVEIESNRGSVTFIFHENTSALRELGGLQINDEVAAISGPFGKPFKIEKLGMVACIADGMGIAQLLSIARALKQAGNKVISFIGAPKKSLLVLQSQMRLASYKIFMTTQDGSFERKGSPTDSLRQFLNSEKLDMIITAGSVELIESVCTIAKERGIQTFVHLNPMIFDGTGVSGSCRVTINGQITSACIEGPIFDGQSIDFADYKMRLNAYKESPWDSYQSTVSQKKSGSEIFGKFLSGIRKS